MDIKIFSLFPEMFQGPLTSSLIGKAVEKGILKFDIINFRDYATNKFKHVDDTPYGGGVGMLLQPQPIVDALRDNIPQDQNIPVILVSPQGKVFTQAEANRLAQYDALAFICGHYEGFDERIRDYVDIQMSLGDFVLTGGESACMVMCDCILRILPGVIRQDSSDDDSFSNGLLEYPQYTRPEIYDGKRVPDVLLSGHHANIKKYRHEESLKRTAMYRPDLLENLNLNKEDQKVVDSVLKIKK